MMKAFLIITFALLVFYVECRYRMRKDEFQKREMNDECKDAMDKLYDENDKATRKLDADCDAAYVKITNVRTAIYETWVKRCGLDFEKMSKECYQEFKVNNEAPIKEISKLDKECDGAYGKLVKDFNKAEAKLKAECSKSV